MLVHCKACGVTYDGYAQCCMELNHVWVPETKEEEEDLKRWEREIAEEAKDKLCGHKRTSSGEIKKEIKQNN